MTAVVVFKNAEDGSLKTILFKKDSSLADLRCRWEETTGLDISYFSMKLGQDALPEDGVIGDLPLLGGGCLKITVERQVCQRISIIGCPDIQISFVIDPTWYPEDMRAVILENLNMKDRKMRIRIDDQLLCDNEQLCQQGFLPSQSIFVDMMVEVEIIDIDTQEIREVSCFASENASVLFNESLPFSSQQLYLDNNRIEMCDCVALCLNLGKEISRSKWILESETCFPIYVFTNRRPRREKFDELFVFSRDIVAKIPRRNGEEIMFSGELVNPMCSFADIGMPENGILYLGKFINLTVINSSEDKFTVVVNKNAGTKELRNLVRTFERTDDFRIMFNGETIDSKILSLMDYGIKDSSKIQLFCKGKVVILQVDGVEMNLGWLNNKTSSETLRWKASEALETLLPPDTVFQCSCGRRFSKMSMNCICPCENSPLVLKTHRPVDVQIFKDDQMLTLRLTTSLLTRDLIRQLQKQFHCDQPSYLVSSGRKLCEDEPLYQVAIASEPILFFYQKISFSIVLSSQEQYISWTAWPDDFLVDILESLKIQNLVVDPKDFTIDGIRQLHVMTTVNGRKLTIKDCGIRPDMTLKVVI